MYCDRRVGVVIPVRDGAATVVETLRRLPAFVDRVVVVDDGSRDGTAAIARRTAGPRHSRLGAKVQVLSHGERRGLGAAVLTGYRALLALEMDLVAVADADVPLDPDDLVRLIDPIAADQADFVKGERLVRVRLSAPLRLSARLLTRVVGRAVGFSPFADLLTASHAVSAEALRHLRLESLWREDAYVGDLLAAVRRAGITVQAVQLCPAWRPRRVPRDLPRALGAAFLRRIVPRRTRRLPEPGVRAAARRLVERQRARASEAVVSTTAVTEVR